MMPWTGAGGLLGPSSLLILPRPGKDLFWNRTCSGMGPVVNEVLDRDHKAPLRSWEVDDGSWYICNNIFSRFLLLSRAWFPGPTV